MAGSPSPRKLPATLRGSDGEGRDDHDRCRSDRLLPPGMYFRRLNAHNIFQKQAVLAVAASSGSSRTLHSLQYC